MDFKELVKGKKEFKYESKEEFIRALKYLSKSEDSTEPQGIPLNELPRRVSISGIPFELRDISVKFDVISIDKPFEKLLYVCSLDNKDESMSKLNYWDFTVQIKFSAVIL